MIHAHGYVLDAPPVVKVIPEPMGDGILAYTHTYPPPEGTRWAEPAPDYNAVCPHCERIDQWFRWPDGGALSCACRIVQGRT
jgi:hypothetical protein